MLKPIFTATEEPHWNVESVRHRQRMDAHDLYN